LHVDVNDKEAFSINTDADQVAQMIAAKLSVKATTRVNRALASGPIPTALRQSMNQVTLALVGVGVLTGKHPLGRWKESEDLTGIETQLARLWKTLARLDNRTQHWCADISNHLFVPIDSGANFESLSKRDRDLLVEEVAEVNGRTVTASVAHFQSICQKGGVVLVAGGEHKLGAIRHVLRQGLKVQVKPWISHLVTDDAAAEALLFDAPSPARSQATITPPKQK
jgi:hypothetical protein